MRNAVPEEDLLLLLGSNTVVLEEKVEKGAFWFFERGIGTSFEIAQVGKDAFFEFFGILHRATERLETESETSDNVGARNMEKIVPIICGQYTCLEGVISSRSVYVPQDTRDIFTSWQSVSLDVFTGRPFDWCSD